MTPPGMKRCPGERDMTSLIQAEMVREYLCECGNVKSYSSDLCIECYRIEQGNGIYHARTLQLTARGWDAVTYGIEDALDPQALFFAAPCISCKTPLTVRRSGTYDHAGLHRCEMARAAA